MIKVLEEINDKFQTSYERGKEFEKVCKFFLLNDSYYKFLFKNVWLWDEWEGKTGPDIGIDIVAEEKNGEFWAIQCKFYSDKVPSSEINKFISTATSNPFSKLLLISTSDITNHSATKLINNTKKSMYIFQDRLESSNINWESFFDSKKEKLIPPKTPKPHQKEAISAIKKGLETSDKGKLIMACGTGKTLIGLWSSEILNSNCTLVLEPSLSLLNQVSLEWISNSKSQFDLLFVCSDDTMDSNIKNSDNFYSSVNELGISTTSNVSEIATFLNKSSKKVIFCTYQSSDKIRNAQEVCNKVIDLTICDEAHHCAGRSGSYFSNILYNEKINSKKRIFMTATPKYIKSKTVPKNDNEIGIVNDLKVASMDDNNLFGEVFYELNFREAIEKDLLNNYRIEIIGITDKEVLDFVENQIDINFTDQKSEEKIQIQNAESIAIVLGLLKIVKKYSIQHLISFHNRVSKAYDFIEKIKEIPSSIKQEIIGGEGWFGHINGKMTTFERSKILNNFKQDTKTTYLLSNARCLGEGVDIRILDGIIFVDPKRSKLDIVQSVGRAIRKSPKNKISTIIIPVFISEEDLATPDIFESSKFKMIADILTSLRSHDYKMGEQLDQINFKISSGEESVIDSLSDLSGINFEISGGSDYKVDFKYENFFKALTSKSIADSSNSWWEYMGILKKYCNDKTLETIDENSELEGYKFGIWVLNQQKSKHLLASNQINALEEINNWEWLEDNQLVSAKDIKEALYLMQDEPLSKINMAKLVGSHGGSARLYDYWYTFKGKQLNNLNNDEEAGKNIVLGFKNNYDFLVIPKKFIREMIHQDDKSWAEMMHEQRLDLYVKKVFHSYKFKIHFKSQKNKSLYIDLTKFKHSIN